MEEYLRPEEPLLLSVSNYIASLNAALKTFHAKIIGEVISVKIAASGHAYFTLKDKEKDAVIECAMWAFPYRANKISLVAGMEVIASGNAQIYAPQGKLSFIAKTLELVGEGALKMAYEKLKSQLTQEGFLASEKKRPLPDFPQRIGVITSLQGAVIHDFLNNIGKRGFSIRFVNSRVEGKEAIFELLHALEVLKEEHLDVLVIMRGGGSFQSLASFDNETLVRAIARFPVPVIAAIGHHQDVPLSALVADYAVSTPTAAANAINASWDDAELLLRQNTATIVSSYADLLHTLRLTIQLKKETISSGFTTILMQFQKLTMRIREYLIVFESTLASANKDLATQWNDRIKRSFTNALKVSTISLVQFERIIALNDPMRLLKHGYTLLKKDGVLVKKLKDVTIGDTVEVVLSDGTIRTKVESTTEKSR